MTNARQVVVTCLDSEVELRFRAWVEQRRQIVDNATGGKVGYIYVQSTGTEEQNEMMRQFTAQVDDDPAQLAKGIDPQLERAIQEVTRRIAAQPKPPARPSYEKRIPGSDR